MSARHNLAKRLRQAFLDHGYQQITMSGLAEVCGLTRRALYHHFSSKEEAFRYTIRFDNEALIRQGLAAGRSRMAEGGTVVDILADVMDVRFGENRRRLAASPHAHEIADQGLRCARDLVVEAQECFLAGLVELLVEIEQQGLIRRCPKISLEVLARMLSDGARGSDLNLPAPPLEQLRQRYADMIHAILFGLAEKP